MNQENQDRSEHALGLDVGGSATRWCLVNRSGRVVLRGEAGGFSGHLSQPDVLGRAQQALASIRQITGPVERMAAGVTGLSRNTPASEALCELMQSHFGASSIEVMSDIELACRCAFPSQAGIVVYAGTGSIAAHLGADGELVTAGGKGVLIDDAGGGYWIAVTALRAVLRIEDMHPGSGWDTMLGHEFAKALGGKDWPEVRKAFYALDRGGIARLALCVAAAAHADDSVALHILHDAGVELALFARMMVGRVGPLPILMAGRAATLHAAIADGMRDALENNGYSGNFSCRQLDQALTAAQCCHEGGSHPKVECGLKVD